MGWSLVRGWATTSLAGHVRRLVMLLVRRGSDHDLAEHLDELIRSKMAYLVSSSRTARAFPPSASAPSG